MMKERNYKYIAIAYMKLFQLKRQVDELASILLVLGSYPENYACHIESIYKSLDGLIDTIEFKYK